MPHTHRTSTRILCGCLLIVLLLVTAVQQPSYAQTPISTSVFIETLNPISVNSIFELPFGWRGTVYLQPEERVSLLVTFITPSARAVQVIGVYESPSLWRAQIVPDEIGVWSWAAVLTDGAQLDEYTGTFTVVAQIPTSTPRPSPAPTILFDPNTTPETATPTILVTLTRAAERADIRTQTREAALALTETPTPEPTPTNASVQPSVPRYSVFEIPFAWRSRTYFNPWEDVTITAQFTPPAGLPVTIGGFHYAPDDYRVRFAPTETGDWTWIVRISDDTRAQEYSGAFTVTESESPGFVRQNPNNPMRWVFDSGAPYYPIGLGDCMVERVPGVSPFETMGLDGELRTLPGESLRDLPPEQEQGRLVSLETYLATYRDAGFNLFRFSQNNCAFGLFRRIAEDGNRYDYQGGVYGDELLQTLREYGFRVYMVMFSFSPPYPGDADNPARMAAVKKAVAYVVNRYGAYVDFWELMNEGYADSNAWYEIVTNHIREVDPYDHPISTSWQRPDVDGIDISSPHWYEREDALQSDVRTAQQIERYGYFGKPVIFGEQGNLIQNWDEGSAVRMRLRTWTAFFNQGVFIFWNTSAIRDYRSQSAANIYLGDEERLYIRNLQNYAALFGSDVLMFEPSGSSDAIRAYGLRSDTMLGVYVVAARDHTRPVEAATITLDVPVDGIALWSSPATGEVIGVQSVAVGVQTLVVPPFTIDAALVIQ